MPGGSQPRCVVEASGPDAGYTAARQAVDPTRAMRAHEPGVQPAAVGHAFDGARFTGGETEEPVFDKAIPNEKALLVMC